VNGALLRLLGWAWVLVPMGAEAHSPIPGIAPFYSGALHSFVVPAHLLSMLGLGLWVGQRGLDFADRAVLVFAVALAAGLALSATAGEPDTDLLLLAGGAAVGLIVALARPMPIVVMVAVAAALGLALGLGSTPDGLVGSKRWVTLAGTWLGGLLGVMWFAAMAEFATRPWLKIAVRVVASWVAASALLVLALSWVGPRREGTAPVAVRAGVAASATIQCA